MDRGQSTTIGFVVIFSMVLLMVALVSVSGYATLGHAQDAERVNNGVRAFEVLAVNAEDVVSEDVPSRTTTVKLDGGQLSAADTTTFEVDVGTDFSHTVELAPIVLDPSGTGSRVVYENGAVVRADPDGQVMVSSPSVLVTADYTVLPVVRTVPVSSTAIGGQDTATIRTTRGETEVFRVDTAGDPVVVTVTGAQSEAWLRYFDGQPGTSCTRIDGATVECTLTTDELTLVVTDVEVRLDN